MRILRICSELYPYILGGIGLHAHDLTRDLLEHDVDSVIYTCLPDYDVEVSFDIPVDVVDFSRKLLVVGNPLCVNMFPKLWKNRYNYDVIHAHSHLFFCTLISAVVRKLGSSPLVITNHGFQSQSAPKWLQKIYLPTVGRWTLNAADVVLCYTDEAKEEIVNAGVSAEKVAVISFGIDTSAFSPCPKKENERFSVIWVGRLAPRKGLKYMLLGFKEFHSKHPNSELKIIGDGEYYLRIKEWISECHLEDCIFLPGKVNYDLIPQYYSDADVFCMTSLYEAGPRTLLEAMSCECPVISTDLEHLKSIIPKCGIMVPTRDSSAISDALENIQMNPVKFKEMGKKGREIILQEYSWSQLVSNVVKIYDKLVDGVNKPKL